jgi:hypothetical protein
MSSMEALLEGVNAERYQVHQAQHRQPSMVEPSLMAMAMAYPPPQQHGLRIAPPRPPETPLNRCWGAELKGGDATTCQPGFQCGKVHFKNKFCSCCRAGIDVPASRIRPLSPELQIAFANSQSEGFWKTGPSHLGGGMLRIINNTAACVGPWLAIYRSEPPALQWGEIPAKWVMDGYVRLCVAKGTLVPDLELRGKSLMRKRDGFAPLPHPAKCVRLEDHSGLLAHAASVAAPVMAVAAQHPLPIENSDGSSTTVDAEGHRVAMPYASAYSGEAGVPVAMPAYAQANTAYPDATATVTGPHPHPPGMRLASHESHSPAPAPLHPHPAPQSPRRPARASPIARASRRLPASCSPPPPRLPFGAQWPWPCQPATSPTTRPTAPSPTSSCARTPAWRRAAGRASPRRWRCPSQSARCSRRTCGSPPPCCAPSAATLAQQRRM